MVVRYKIKGKEKIKDFTAVWNVMVTVALPSAVKKKSERKKSVCKVFMLSMGMSGISKRDHFGENWTLFYL